jgi:glutamyl-tRNA synthetase
MKDNVLELMKEMSGRIEQSKRFDQKDIVVLFENFLEEKQIKLGKIAQPVRVALTGKTASPGLFEVMGALGREKVLRRLKEAVKHIRAKG